MADELGKECGGCEIKERESMKRQEYRTCNVSVLVLERLIGALDGALCFC